MKMQSSKIIAIITGFISILICLGYLLLVFIFDSRTLFESLIINPSDSAGVISYILNNSYFY